LFGNSSKFVNVYVSILFYVPLFEGGLYFVRIDGAELVTLEFEFPVVDRVAHVDVDEVENVLRELEEEVLLGLEKIVEVHELLVSVLIDAGPDGLLHLVAHEAFELLLGLHLTRFGVLLDELGEVAVVRFTLDAVLVVLMHTRVYAGGGEFDYFSRLGGHPLGSERVEHF